MQREKDGISPQQLSVTLGLPKDAKVLVSGGQIESFREGWAINIMPAGSVGHYFKRTQFDIAVSKCGQRSVIRWLYGLGNMPKCKRCEQRLKIEQKVMG